MGHWTNKVVLVTGGSAGLGLEIVRQFAAAGATTVALGRDEDRLGEVRTRLAADHLAVDMIRADVTDHEQVIGAIQSVVARHGRLDVLINNVGKSIRIGVREATIDDFRELMELNFYSAVRCTAAALPYLEQSSGHVVNVGSLASKTAWPFLAPYSASKFALAAYTHQLRLEGPTNVHYMLVCPGPVKRRDAGRRYRESAVPDPARRPGAGARVEIIDPVRLARKIVRGCELRKREIVFPFRARILFTVLAYSPPLGDWLLRRVMHRN
jgi:short-subunit dehydrogenase